jgi:hypothetical protein
LLSKHHNRARQRPCRRPELAHLKVGVETTDPATGKPTLTLEALGWPRSEPAPHPPAPKMVYAIGSMEYAAEQERLRLQRLQRAERGEDEDE